MPHKEKKARGQEKTFTAQGTAQGTAHAKGQRPLSSAATRLQWGSLRAVHLNGGSSLNVCHVIIPTNPRDLDVVVPISKMRKLRFQEVRRFSQGFPGSKPRSHGLEASVPAASLGTDDVGEEQGGR